jgi:hypothetical protein
MLIKGSIIKGVYYVLNSVTQPLAYAKNGDRQFWKEKFHGAKGKVQHTLMMCFGFFLLGLGWGEFFFVKICNHSLLLPLTQATMVTNNYGNQSFMHAANESFLLCGGGGEWVVFWLLGSSHVFIFTCLWLKTLLRIMCFLKVFARDKSKKKLKKDEELLEVSITISVGCCDIPTKMLVIMEKFIEDKCV